MNEVTKKKSSIDKLFAEPFKPVWMTRQRQADAHFARESTKLFLKGIDDDYKLRALKSRQKIIARCDGNKYT
jgi:hypothetical protein